MPPSFVPRDLARMPEIVAADLAPDGTGTVYAANTVDGSTTVEFTQLWREPLAGNPERLAGSDSTQTAPSFSPDGARIAFLTEVGDAMQVAVVPSAGGELRVLTEFPRGVGGGVAPQWSPDSTVLAFVASDSARRDPAAPYRITRPVWRRDGMGLVEDVRADVWTVPADGGAPTRLTSHDGVVTGVQWSPDGTTLLYDLFAEPDTSEVSLRTVTADGGRTDLVLSAEYLVYAPTATWLPDGRIVHTTDWDVYTRLNLVVVDPATGSRNPVPVDLPGQLGGQMQMGMNSALFTPRLLAEPDGDAVLFHVQTGGRLELARVHLGSGAAEVLHTGDFSVVPVVQRGRQVLLARTSFSAPTSLAVLDLTDGSEVAASSLAPAWLAEAPFTVHALEFTGSDGTPVEGWFLEPLGGEGPYATVLNVHGGPFAVYGHGFSIDDHLFTTAGYGVLLVNFRGSSGYGEDFSEVLLADWGNHDAGDLHAGLDHAIGLGLVDPERIGSFGLSGGGYMTSWLLTHSDRFSAGIAECPVTDWNGMIGSDIPQVVGRWMGNGPGEGPEGMAPYARMSPATYAASCTTPMLVIEHEDDLRCPVGQGDVMYNALTLSGCTTEMLRLPGMSHTDPYSVGDLRGRTERLAALLDWFDRFLKA